jgi:hypothetical protein
MLHYRAYTSVGALVMQKRFLKTREPSCMPRAAKPFFIPVVDSPSRAVGHVVAPELPLSGSQSPEPWDTWQHRSSPHQGGKVWSRGTRGSARAHLSKEVRSGVAGHVVAPEPTSAGRCGPKLQLMWQHMDARSPPCLDLEPVCRGMRYLGYRQLCVSM